MPPDHPFKSTGNVAPVMSAQPIMHRFFVRHAITRSKTEHAIEQDRPDVLKQRHHWFDGQLDLDQNAWSSSTRPRRRPT